MHREARAGLGRLFRPNTAAAQSGAAVNFGGWGNFTPGEIAQMPSSEEVQHLAVHFAGNVDEGIPQQSRCNELITLKTLAVRGTIVREHGFICGLRWVGWQWW